MIVGQTGAVQRCTQCTRNRENALNEQLEFGIECEDSNCSFKQDIEAMFQSALPIIRYFKATPEFIKEDESIILEWELENVDSIELSHIVGELAPDIRTIEFIPPEGNLEIKLTVRNRFETSSVLLLKPLPINILRFEVNKTIVLSNSLVELNWEVEGAKSIKVNDDTDVTDINHYPYRVRNDDEDIELVVYGHFGIEELSEIITVKIAQIEYFEHIEEQNNYFLEWETTNIQRIEIKKNGERIGSYTGMSAKQNRKQVFASDEDVTYVLKAYTIYDECVTQTIELKAVIIDYFSANETIVYESMPVQLDWSTQNAVEVILQPLDLILPIQGHHIIEISEDELEYELVAKGRINVVKKRVKFKVVKITKVKDLKIQIPKIRTPNHIAVQLNSKNITIPNLQSNQVTFTQKQTVLQHTLKSIKGNTNHLISFLKKQQYRIFNLSKIKQIQQINIPSQNEIRQHVSIAEFENNNEL